MSIKDQLTEDMKQAMKAHNKVALETIRLARANIKNVEINDKKELTEDEVIAVLMKEVKMRQDSLAEFEKAGRTDLIDQAKAEIEVLQKYLPAAMEDDELQSLVKEIIAETGAASMKDMGKVMGVASKQMAGKADGRIISGIVKKLLA